jgi:hypothetical protein
MLDALSGCLVTVEQGNVFRLSSMGTLALVEPSFSR